MKDYKELKKEIHTKIDGYASTQEGDINEKSKDESVFSIEPKLVVYPKNTKDVQETLKILNSKKGKLFSITPRAAGTGLSGGSLTDSIVLDVTKYMNNISEVKMISDKELEIDVEPGAYFRDIESKLNDLGFYIPVAPASKDICAIGGMVGNNAAGPDSLQHGHTANFVKQLEIVLSDGSVENIGPINFERLKNKISKENFASTIYKEVWEMIDTSSEYKTSKESRPKTKKNSSGYNIWDVLSTDPEEFKKGVGFFDLTKLIVGSQGSIGIVTKIRLRAIKRGKLSPLIVVPVFEVDKIGETISEISAYDPHNLELFDDITLKMALKKPGFFYDFLIRKNNCSKLEYIGFVFWMYYSFIFDFKFKIPKFVLMTNFEKETEVESKRISEKLFSEIKESRKAFYVKNKAKENMLWKVRGSSYSLAKLKDKTKSPAAFLEDMVVPIGSLPSFIKELDGRLKKHKLEYAIHGHGGDGHLHFYPLFDFTDPKTPDRILKISEEFFSLASKHNGYICGEHNDGIIRTPFMHENFDPETLEIFKQIEDIFDPNDLLNPGKKTYPKYDILENIKKEN